MNDVVNVHDLKTNYSKYLDQVINGQEIFLGKHGKMVAKIVPLDKHEIKRKPGALKGKIWTRNDFDEPMSDLWDAIKAK